jgi:eukaryotic-like serine/threonine-protein kinase
MSNATLCLSDEDLMPLLAGESGDAQVASHLRECSVCRSRIDLFKSDLAALRSAMIQEAAAPPQPARPARIGKYLVVGRLGSGGQADVFRAVHPTLDTELVVKLSRRGVGRLSDHRPLLIAEGKLLAKLDHPGLARVYDLDFHDDQPFLAMEYVRGPNLRQFADDKPVSPKTAAALVAQVARALGVVHRHGIVHQDIKPHNVLVDENGQARLIDFGMARLRHAWDDSGDRITGGTVAFMAPEQARNEDTAVGPRSDVFALGGVLYYLLTGKPPFQADSINDTLVKAGRAEFDREALDKPGIPRRLRNICFNAMAAKPADRYACADDLAADLERFLAGPKRLRRRLALAGAALAVIALGIGLWIVSSKPKSDASLEWTQEVSASLQLFVSRDGQLIDLLAAAPIDSAVDRFQVVGRIPAGHHAVLLHINGKGEVKKLSFRESPGDKFTRIVFPADDKLAALDEGASGTEFVLLCSAESAEALAGLEQIVKEALGSLPLIDSRTIWQLTRDEVQRQTGARNTPAEAGPTGPTRPELHFGDKSRMVPGPETNAALAVELKLDELRKRLRGLPLSQFYGVAYSRP